MTDINQARVQIYDRFITEWGTETLYDLDNEDFKPPTKEPWVRLVVRNTSSNQDSLGPIGVRKFLRGGSVLVQVFVPVDIGLEESDRLAELVRVIFEGVRLDEDLWLNETTTRELGPRGAWYQVTVETVFFYEQTK